MPYFIHICLIWEVRIKLVLLFRYSSQSYACKFIITYLVLYFQEESKAIAMFYQAIKAAGKHCDMEHILQNKHFVAVRGTALLKN